MKVPNRILKTIWHLANGTSKDGKSVITPEERADVLQWATAGIDKRQARQTEANQSKNVEA